MDSAPVTDLSQMVDGAVVESREHRATKAPVKFGTFSSAAEIESALNGNGDIPAYGMRTNKFLAKAKPASKVGRSRKPATASQKRQANAGKKQTVLKTQESKLAEDSSEENVEPDGKRTKSSHSASHGDTQEQVVFTPPASSSVGKQIKSLPSPNDNSLENDTASKKRPLETKTSTRPEPFAEPLVWADGRQALCETLPNYRAYQSGAYTSQGLAHGFLLSFDSADRSHMDEETVITRAGGNCERDASGNMRQVRAHSMSDANVQSFNRSMEIGYSLLMIVGKDNRQCPSQPPHEYNVMEYFQITDIWYEKNNEQVCIKYRLEKIDLHSKSWWAKAGTPLPPTAAERDYSIKAHKQRCLECGKTSKQILDQGWTCLRADCRKFWKMPSGRHPNKGAVYNADFLKERTQWKGGNPPFAIPPDAEDIIEELDATPPYSLGDWKGFICPKCGRCNSRSEWIFWKCDSEVCDFTRPTTKFVLSPRAVSLGQAQYSGHATPLDSYTDAIKLRRYTFGNWLVHEYTLCDGNTIHHLMANKYVNREPGGPDDIFKALQEGDGCGLVRGEMTAKTSTGKALARHFSKNFGLPYKYVVKVASQSFGSAPKAILDALSRMTWAGRKTANDSGKQEFVDFNELLAVGYFTGCKMGYHDDGEMSLGPTIATLSLGGSAKMMLRMKRRYHAGKTKAADRYNHLEPVLPGSFLEHERRALNARHGEMSQKEFDKAIAAMYGKAGRPSTPSVLLTMELRHGDIVVMNGSEMQKYYEHSVVPQGQVRFGLTCRYIKPDLVDKSEHWKAIYDSSVVTAYQGYESQGPARGLSPVSSVGVAVAGVVNEPVTSDSSSLTSLTNTPAPTATVSDLSTVDASDHYATVESLPPKVGATEQDVPMHSGSEQQAESSRESTGTDDSDIQAIRAYMGLQ